MRNNSIYKDLSVDELENHLSDFLVSKWSYSMVTSFARNEKAFEKTYIYGVYSKKSASSVAGQAYHEALRWYFQNKKEGKEIDIVECEQVAFEYIDQIPANQWKIQRTTPSVEECQQKCYITTSSLIRNFFAEIGTYENEIDQVLAVELKSTVFLVVNGVDIPLPCSFIIDLVVKTKEGKIAIVDHKSKAAFSSEEEIAMSIGTQAITYVLAYEELEDVQVDEVWFVENKYSKNKDGKPQLNSFKIGIDENTRKLYEALLYEPLRRMIQATSDPDYVYLINESDNFEDKAELYDFWARTMISEVEDFNVEESKKALVAKRLRKIKDSSIEMIPPSVIKKFKENASKFIQYDLSKTDMTAQEKIEHVLRSFGVSVRVAHTFEGYSSNTFLLEFSAGVKIGSIYSKRLDIANALNVANVRISNELVVFEGRSFVSIEYAKKREQDLLFDASLLEDQRIPLGRDNFQNLVCWDWENHSTPHMLVCGATGSGKSVLVKTCIEYAKQLNADIVILDPKFEFSSYGYDGVEVVQEILEIEEKLAELVKRMEQYVREGQDKRTFIVFDEFADAVANSRSANELKIYDMKFEGYYANGNVKSKRVCVGELNSLEENLRILLQKGRSSGFRILAALQRADTKVITGNAKVNFPVQVCFRVPKAIDSKVVLDQEGAESLAGQGDGLINSPEYTDVVRFQAFYKPDGEKKKAKKPFIETIEAEEV